MQARIAAPRTPAVLVVMGVSGSGKTTIGQLLARRLQWEFADADFFHPDANKKKMASGIPLADEDRWPWLHAIAAWVDEVRNSERRGVVTCSALKRVYRDIVIGSRDDVRLVYLQGSRELIERRMATRSGHFMPSTLLESQFATLEEPGPDENPVVVSIAADPQAIAQEILARLGLASRA